MWFCLFGRKDQAVAGVQIHGLGEHAHAETGRLFAAVASAFSAAALSPEATASRVRRTGAWAATSSCA